MVLIEIVPRFNPIVVQRIENALLETEARINHEYIKTIAKTYYTTTITIYKHKTQLATEISIKPTTSRQIKIVTPEMDTTIIFVLNQFL